MEMPSNHERLQAISDVVREELSRHEEKGGVYHDLQAAIIAKKAIETCMPGLAELQNSRIIVEASAAVLLGDEDPLSLDGIHVEGAFQRISIQQVISSIESGETPLQLSTFDLCAVLTPQYADPDPRDLVFGKELYVPFKSIDLFEQAA